MGTNVSEQLTWVPTFRSNSLGYQRFEATDLGTVSEKLAWVPTFRSNSLGYRFGATDLGTCVSEQLTWYQYFGATDLGTTVSEQLTASAFTRTRNSTFTRKWVIAYPTIRLHRPQCSTKTSQEFQACIVSVFCKGVELGRSL